MSDKNEETIVADPEPEEPKRKKRRPRKKKEEDKKEDSVVQLKEQEQGQNSEQEQNSEQDMLDDLGINVNFQFLMTIRDILVNITPRVNWNPNELIPVGMVIRDLNSIATNVNAQLSQTDKKNNEEEEDDDEDDDVDETSEVIN
tara:strand:+ start:66 stop:497 length:432 start_codon:yes stop_codon:yes gene_type:complete